MITLGKKYTREEIDRLLVLSLKDSSKIYSIGPINYKGNIKRTNTPYIEYISEKLLDSRVIDRIKKITPITRKGSYKWNHNSKSNDKSNRKEEIFAKKLKGKEFPGLGKIIDYQVPLKNERNNKAGKIDLISNNNYIHLIELKYESEETLLRCVLEIATYYQVLDKTKFLNDFNLPRKHIKKAVLILKNSNPHKDFENLKNMPHLAKLIKELEISIFTIIDDKPTIQKVL